MDQERATRWLEALAGAWRNRDPEAVVGLFSDGAVYRAHPFRPPLHGRAAIAEYWAAATVNLEGIEVRFGDPIVSGDRVAVEWWAVSIEAGDLTTDAGSLFLRFGDAGCQELREYWNVAPGEIPAAEGWGE